MTVPKSLYKPASRFLWKNPAVNYVDSVLYNTNLQTNKTNPQKEQRYGDGNNYISFLKMKYINKLFKYVYIFPKGMCKAQQVF